MSVGLIAGYMTEWCLHSHDMLCEMHLHILGHSPQEMCSPLWDFSSGVSKHKRLVFLPLGKTLAWEPPTLPSSAGCLQNMTTASPRLKERKTGHSTTSFSHWCDPEIPHIPPDPCSSTYSFLTTTFLSPCRCDKCPTSSSAQQMPAWSMTGTSHTWWPSSASSTTTTSPSPPSPPASAPSATTWTVTIAARGLNRVSPSRLVPKHKLKDTPFFLWKASNHNLWPLSLSLCHLPTDPARWPSPAHRPWKLHPCL